MPEVCMHACVCVSVCVVVGGAEVHSMAESSTFPIVPIYGIQVSLILSSKTGINDYLALHDNFCCGLLQHCAILPALC